MLERRKFVSRHNQITGHVAPPERWNLDYGEAPKPIAFDGTHTRLIHGANTYGKSAALEHLTHALTESVELFKREERRRRDLPQVMVMPKWVADLLTWCRDRGMTTTDTAIAAWLGVTRQTVAKWKQEIAPRPKAIATIIKKTNGEIDPRRRRP